MNKLSSVIESILFVSGKEVEESFIKEKLEISDRQFNEAVSELLVKYDSACGITCYVSTKNCSLQATPATPRKWKRCLIPSRKRN